MMRSLEAPISDTRHTNRPQQSGWFSRLVAVRKHKRSRHETPNASTAAAIREIEEGRGITFANKKEYFEWLDS